MRKVSFFIGTLAAMVAFMGLSAQALAIPPIDLLIDFDVRIDEAGTYGGHDWAGYSVSDAGDVNGDGIHDVIVGADQADAHGRGDNGCAYVVYGNPSRTGTIDLADFAAPGNREGFRICGAAWNDGAGYSVSAAGNVNGDGYDDVIVGAWQADNNDRDRSGSAYVIYGQAQPTNVDLARLGARGFRIDGAADCGAYCPGGGDYAGQSVSGAGDVDNDSYDDVIVGAPEADNNGRWDSGSAYVIYGQAQPTNVDLARLGEDRGFRIDGAYIWAEAGYSVSDAGDVNDDGLDDVIVGDPWADNGRWDSGSAYVIYGQAQPTNVDLARLGEDRGFRIDGAAAGSWAGLSVSAAGDVDGNGIPDVIVGAIGSHYNGLDSGSAYVVYGKSGNRDTVDLRDFEAPGNREGFRIDGAAEFDWAGYSVSGAGDVNRDGMPDVIVGAFRANNNDRVFSGSAYVVYGKSGNWDTVDLRDFEAPGNREGFRIDGAVAGDQAGWSVSGAGDFNADGCDDVIVGAPMGYSSFGSAYIVNGCRAVVHADPTCNERQNPFQVLGLDMDTPDTLEAYQRSSITGSFRLCGSKIDPAQSYEAGGASVNFVRAEVKMPPGVRRNTQSIPPLTSYMGEMKLDLLTWRGDPRSPIFRANVPLTLRLDAPTSDTDCPADAYPCFKGQTTEAGITGHNWSWITNIGGRLTYVIGEFHNDSGSPAGMTGVNFRLCRYAGNITGGTTTGCGNQEAPHLLTNGDPSAPDCNQGQGPNGIYDVTGYWRNGDSTPQTAGSRACVPWYLRMIRYPGKLLPIDPGKIKPLPPGGRIGKGDKGPGDKRVPPRKGKPTPPKALKGGRLGEGIIGGG